jgi:hypothetical protein
MVNIIIIVSNNFLVMKLIYFNLIKNLVNYIDEQKYIICTDNTRTIPV